MARALAQENPPSPSAPRSPLARTLALFPPCTPPSSSAPSPFPVLPSLSSQKPTYTVIPESVHVLYDQDEAGDNFSTWYSSFGVKDFRVSLIHYDQSFDPLDYVDVSKEEVLQQCRSLCSSSYSPGVLHLAQAGHLEAGGKCQPLDGHVVSKRKVARVG